MSVGVILWQPILAQSNKVEELAKLSAQAKALKNNRISFNDSVCKAFLHIEKSEEYEPASWELKKIITSKYDGVQEILDCLEKGFREQGNTTGLAYHAEGWYQFYFNEGKMEKALVYLHQAKPLAFQSKDATIENTILRRLGVYYLIQNNFDSGTHYLNLALEHMPKADTTNFLVVNNNIGYTYYTTGKFHTAHRYFKDGLEKASPKNGKIYWFLKNNLGLSLLKMRQLDQALEWYNEVLSEPGLVYADVQEVLMQNLASAYLRTHQYEKADSMLTLLWETDSLRFNPVETAYYLNEWATMTGDSAEAKKWFDESVLLVQQNPRYGNIRLQDISYRYFSAFGRPLLNMDQLMEYYKTAVENRNHQTEMAVLNQLVYLAVKAGKTDEALDFSQKLSMAADSTTSNLIFTALADFSRAEELRQISNKLEQEKLLKEKEKSRRKLMTQASIPFVALALALLLSLWMNYKSVRKRFKLREAEVKKLTEEIEDKNRQLNQQKIDEALENERNTILSYLIEEVRTFQMIAKGDHKAEPQLNEKLKHRLAELEQRLERALNKEKNTSLDEILRTARNQKDDQLAILKTHLSDFTNRELEIVLFAGMNHRTKEIANYLDVSVGYVDNVRSKTRKSLKLKRGEDLSASIQKLLMQK